LGQQGGGNNSNESQFMSDPKDVSVSKLLSKIVCALVDRPEWVVIKTHVTEEGTSFTIEVHPDDTGKVIGRQGRNANSLRTIVNALGQKLHRRYFLEPMRET